MLPGPPPTSRQEINMKTNAQMWWSMLCERPVREADRAILDRAGRGTEWVSEEVMFSCDLRREMTGREQREKSPGRRRTATAGGLVSHRAWQGKEVHERRAGREGSSDQLQGEP